MSEPVNKNLPSVGVISSNVMAVVHDIGAFPADSTLETEEVKVWLIQAVYCLREQKKKLNNIKKLLEDK